MANTPLLALRVSKEAQLRWQAAARAEGLTLSDWIRGLANAALEKNSTALAIADEIEIVRDEDLEIVDATRSRGASKTSAA